MIEHFSTRSVEMCSRLDFWNQLLGETYAGLVVDPVQPQFHAQLARWRLGDMTMIWPQSAAAVVARRRGYETHAQQQKIVVHQVHSGECTLSQRGRVTTLKTGDMVLCAGEEY